MTRRILIDTDPGKDDAVALLLALASPELEVIGVIAVAGNVSVARTVENARRLVALAGRSDVPVYAGCAGPLLRPPVTAEHVHGDTGLGALVLAESDVALAPGHGVDALIDIVRAEPAGSVTLCLLGPATNLAMALVKAPDIKARIAEVVWMAGAAREGGNVTPAAEFNVFADPHAAEIVLASSVRLTLVPLDLTHQVRLDQARKATLRAIDSAAARAVATLFPEGAAPLHDPCVIGYLLDSEMFRGERYHVAVETQSPLTMGMTVVDRREKTGRSANALWLDVADAERFFSLLFRRLA